jgi:hypothetical protein
MLTHPHLSQFVLPEFIPYIKSAIKLCNDNNTADVLEIKSFVDDTITANNPVEAAYAYQKDSPYTIKIEARDMRRDRGVVGIRAECFAKINHFDPAIVAAAETVLHCYDKYGKRIQDLSLVIETEIIDQLINDFENDTTVSAAITTLGLKPWVAELKAANKDFKEIYIERIKKYADKPSLPAHQLKPAAVVAFNELFKQIDSRNNIDKTGKYKMLIAQLNALTEQYNTAAKRRRKGGNGGEKNNDTDTPKA